jgi:hypothetical protein
MSWLVGSLAALLGPAAPIPEPPTPVVALEWIAPPGCPDADAIEARIVELVGRPLGTDPTRVLGVTGTVTADANEFVLDLVLHPPDGGEVSRRLAAQTCAELAEPAAVVVAIAVVPDAGADDTEGVVVPPSPRSPEVASDEAHALAPLGPALEPAPRGRATTDRQRTPRVRRRVRPRGVVGAYGGIAGGVLPSVGGALQADLGLAFPSLRIDLVVTHEFRRRIAGSRGGGLFDVTAVRPEICWTPGRGRWRFPLCAGPELGALRAGGFGVDVTRRVRHVWFALAAGAGVTASLHRFVGLRLRAELVASPLLREFTLDGARLSRTGPLGARATFGVETWFP